MQGGGLALGRGTYAAGRSLVDAWRTGGWRLAAAEIAPTTMMTAETAAVVGLSATGLGEAPPTPLSGPVSSARRVVSRFADGGADAVQATRASPLHADVPLLTHEPINPRNLPVPVPPARSAADRGQTFTTTEGPGFQVSVQNSATAGATYREIVSRVPGRILSEADAISPGILGTDLRGLPGTFSGGRYASVQLDEAATVYRSWTPGQSREFGAFWSLERPVGSLQTRIDSALLPEWGSIRGTPFSAQATHYTMVRLPSGTVIHVGEVGSQGGAWVGGKSQLLIEGGAQEAWKIGGDRLR